MTATLVNRGGIRPVWVVHAAVKTRETVPPKRPAVNNPHVRSQGGTAATGGVSANRLYGFGHIMALGRMA